MKTEKPEKARPDNGRRAFARALTRSLFGRHYWNDQLQKELVAANKKSPKKKRKTKR